MLLPAELPKSRGSNCTHGHFGLSSCLCLHPQCHCSTSQLQSKRNSRQLRMRCSNTAVIHIIWNRQPTCVPTKTKPFMTVSTFSVFQQLWRVSAKSHGSLSFQSLQSALPLRCVSPSLLNHSAFDKRGLKEFLTVFSLETLVKHFLAFVHFRLFKTSRQEFQHRIAQHPQRRHRRTKTTSTIWVLQADLRGC